MEGPNEPVQPVKYLEDKEVIFIGKNDKGNEIFEGVNGVRHVLENGIAIIERARNNKKLENTH